MSAAMGHPTLRPHTHRSPCRRGCSQHGWIRGDPCLLTLASGPANRTYPARFGPTYEDYYGGGSPELDPIKHPTIAHLLKEVGYRTGCFGKWNVSNLNRRRANDFGFDRWVGRHLNHNF